MNILNQRFNNVVWMKVIRKVSKLKNNPILRNGLEKEGPVGECKSFQKIERVVNRPLMSGT